MEGHRLGRPVPEAGGDYVILEASAPGLARFLMPSPAHFSIHLLGPRDVRRLDAMSAMFGRAFEDPATYRDSPPGAAYLERLLGRDDFIALAAMKGADVVGGLVAYELHKFEQERSEIYIYDLAVAEAHRREGVATALIEELKRIAGSRNAYVIFVQADRGDEAAIALYTKLGAREDVLHFDIPVRDETGER